jgi:quercetin dioxygenase-like cupin family protein
MRHGGRFHLDDRGIRYCDIFPEIEKGRYKCFCIEPGAAALWHRHKIQADYQIVVKGSLKVGLCNLPNTNFDMSIPDKDCKN